MKKKIVVLAGDGIGPEIMASGVTILKKAVEHSDSQFEFEEHPFGGSGIDAKGDPLPEETLAACQSADAILLGAIGGPKWEQAEKTPEQGLLALRKALHLFANIRPISVPDALLPLSPIKEEIVKGTDFVVVRELTSGIYFGEPRHLGLEEAYDTNRYQAEEIRRIMRKAFEIAQGRRKYVLSVDKANVLATSKLWRKVAEEIAQEFPDCTLEHQYVDSAAMRIVQHPTAFDVIVTENLFGDILSDEASVLPGTLGVLPSASHGEAGVSLYEPIHGSAPDIAGQNIANPVSMILSASLMLRQSFHMNQEAERIERACFEAMESGVLTKDLGGKSTTTEFTEAILEKINELVENLNTKEVFIMGKTLFDKVWERHVVSGEEGEAQLLYIDLQMIHEVTSPQAFEGLREAGRTVRRPDKTFGTMDHNVPTQDIFNITDLISKKQMDTLRRNCEEFGITLCDNGSDRQGIVHMVGPEVGLTQPGKTIVCGDSHTATHGAFGAIAFGIGTSEVEHVLATQTIWQKKPKRLGVHVTGKLARGVYAKDIILALIAKYGVDFGVGYAAEFYGDTIEGLTMEERMTICNMSIEGGAKMGMMAPDEKTIEFVRDREYAPKDMEAAIADWQTLYTDEDAEYDCVLELDATTLEPYITWGTNPEMGVSFNEPFPEIKDHNDQLAYEYMDLQPGQKAADIVIEYVFIGSCTNGRLSDLQEAAKNFKREKIKAGVTGIVVPGSRPVRKAAEKIGLDKIFMDAGFEWREPGCSMCLGMNPDKVPEFVHCASTSNRNFVGRQGKNSRTHLCSPAMAAAAAINGHFVDVREIIGEVVS